MPGLELFHRLADPDSAAARIVVRELGLLEAVAFRNVAFDSHREALAALGGGATPALWDGARLHVGLDAVRAALAGRAPPGPGGPGTALGPAPASLLGPDGAPRLGAFAGVVGDAGTAALAGRGVAGRLRRLARGKRWVYALAVSEDVLAAVAIVEAGYFGGGFAWAVDRRTGAVLHDASTAGLPRLNARVDGRAGDGARARLVGRGLAIDVACDGARWTISASAGRAFALDVVLERASAAPFALVAPVTGGGVRATHKVAALAASGRVRVGDRALSLEGGSGGVDVTAGLLARETSWRWAFGTGRAGGAPFGFNLCEGWALPPDDPGENAGFAGAPYRLPPVSFEVGGASAPWRIKSAGGEVDLVFRPAGAHREARNLGLVVTRFTQVAGVFEGHLPGPGGEPVDVAALPGVAEDHWARW